MHKPVGRANNGQLRVFVAEDEKRTPIDLSATQIPPGGNSELLSKPKAQPDIEGFEKHD